MVVLVILKLTFYNDGASFWDIVFDVTYLLSNSAIEVQKASTTIGMSPVAKAR